MPWSSLQSFNCHSSKSSPLKFRGRVSTFCNGSLIIGMCRSGRSDSSDASLRGVSSLSTACSLGINFSWALWPRDIANTSLACDFGVGDSVEGSLGSSGESGNVPGT